MVGREFRVLHGVALLETPTEQNKAFVGFVLARELADFASIERGGRRDVIGRLFEENVRGYLKGEKYYDNPGALALAKTIASGRGSDLLLLHNGIVIVASVAHKFPQSHAIALKNAQIVNGCQSVHTLVENFAALGEASVPIKIVVTEQDALRQQIIIASNTQEPLTDYDYLSRDKGLRRLADIFDTAEIPLAQKTWLKRRLGQRIDWPPEWRGDTDTTRIITPRHLLETYVSTVSGEPHIVHDQRGIALQKVTRGEIFSALHEPTLYRALAWLPVVGRRWAVREGTWNWHDRFLRSGRGAYPARHHYCLALWRIADTMPDACDHASLVASTTNRDRFERLIDALSTRDIALGDAAGCAVQSAARSLGKRLDSILVRSPKMTAAVKHAADVERTRLLALSENE